MSTSLLTTKLFVPPAHPRLVPRPRLLQRLDQGISCRLTLVSAPAGFGKTTLLSEWISQAGVPVAWISLDEGDNEVPRFLSYLIAALQRICPGVGEGALAALQTGQAPPIESVLTVVINDLIAASSAGDSAIVPVILVLDDYHVLRSGPVHDILAFLLDHMPSHMHLIVATREDPPVPLARWRARGHVTELRERELRFTAEESTALFNQVMGLGLSADSIAALETRTEGWIAGLTLAALSLQDRQDTDDFVASFAGDDRYVMDYLVEEVLNRQPEAIQGFLLRTSILNRLCASVCDSLVSDLKLGSPSQAILERLEAMNLFVIPLDSQREWYRYHQLFADLLRHRLRRTAPDLPSDLHRLASRWHEQAGDIDEAIYHAFAVPDYPLAAHLAEQYVLRMVGGSRITTYLGWIQRIPDNLVHSRPYLCAGVGWAYALTWQAEAAEEYVRAGEMALPNLERLYSAPEKRFITREEVRGHLTAIRAHCARIRGDFPGAIEQCRIALNQLPADARTVRCIVALILGQLYLEIGDLEMAQPALDEAFRMARRSGENPYAAVAALSLKGNVLVAEGKLLEGAECCGEAITLGTEGHSPIPATCLAYLGLATVHYHRNEPAAAAGILEKGLELALQVGNREALTEIHLLQARLAVAAGELSQAELFAGKARDCIRSSGITDLLPSLWAALRAELSLAEGDVDGAGHCLEERGVTALNLAVPNGPGMDRACLCEYLALSRVLLAQGRPDQAVALLDELVMLAGEARHVVTTLEARIVQAVAYQSQGKGALALERLNGALALGMPEGFVRCFLDAGEPMEKLLRKSVTRNPGATYALQVLAAFSAGDRREDRRGQYSFSAPSSASARQLQEPLTEREREALRLLALRLSSNEIADELVIAVSTARSYIKSLYGKLGAHSREEAVARGRRLGLI